MNRKSSKITRFKFPTGELLAGKYEVVARLGAGWEGEVYLVREKGTGIERTAKSSFHNVTRAIEHFVFMPESFTSCDNVLS